MLTAATVENLRRPLVCGVYKLTVPSGAFYIGSSKDIERRIVHHEWSVRHSRFDRSPKLYRAIAKYGTFDRQILLVCAPKDLVLYEQACIDALKPKLNSSGLAARVEMTPAVRAKIGAANSRRPVELECSQCARAFVVKPHAAARSFCSRQCAGKSRQGQKRPEVGQIISAAKKGRSNGITGRIISQETREKIRVSLKGRRHTPDRIEAIRRGIAGRC